MAAWKLYIDICPKHGFHSFSLHLAWLAAEIIGIIFLATVKSTIDPVLKAQHHDCSVMFMFNDSS